MTVLVIAPHADDEVIGMGGTIARLTSAGERVVLAVLTGHGDQPHPLWPREKWDQIRRECRAAASVLGVSDIEFRELPAACLDVMPAWQINKVVHELLQAIAPTEIYIPFPFDLHKDHGAVAYAVTVAARPFLKHAQSIRRVLAYETLSETHLAPPHFAPAFEPNLFVDISSTLENKLQAMRAYASQVQPDDQPRSVSALRALAALRGAHIGRPAAEAFVILGEYQR